MEIKYKIGKIKTYRKSLEDKQMGKGVRSRKKCTNCTKNRGSNEADHLEAAPAFPEIIPVWSNNPL